MGKQTQIALELAYNAHRDQVDKGGNPYILHPISLALSERAVSSDQKIVCLLHDVVEDTKTTFEDMSKAGIEDHIIRALELLTHKNNVDYHAYIHNIKKSGNDLAINCKIIDLTHNADLTRIPNPTKEDRKRVVKYNEALNILIDVNI